MQQLNDGLDLDQGVLIQVQNNTIAQQAIRIVQLEAGVQQLMNQQNEMQAHINKFVPSDEETKDASAN